MDERYEHDGISRRDALKKGAVIASAAWVVPAVQALSMSSASADGPSGSSNSSNNNGNHGKNKKPRKKPHPVRP
jgi:hypothetical protein